MSSSADSGSVSTRSYPAARAELLRVLLLPDFERARTIGEAISRTEILAAYRRGCGQAALGARVKAVVALGIIAVLGFLGFQVADPPYDAAARTICSNYAEDEGLVLVEARGMRTGRLAFRSFPDYSCRFRDSAGSAVFVDENDRLIEPMWTYRALRAAGWLAWTVGIVAGVGISAAFGLMKRD